VDRNEAITIVANAAIKAIQDFSLQTMETLRNVSSEKEQAFILPIQKKEPTVDSATPASANTSDVQERKKPGPKPGSKRTPKPEESEDIFASTKVESVEHTEVAEVFDIDKGVFPDYPMEWFKENLEEAKTICRAIASKRLAGSDLDTTRKEMAQITGVFNVTKFEPEHCMQYYNHWKAFYTL